MHILLKLFAKRNLLLYLNCRDHGKYRDEKQADGLKTPWTDFHFTMGIARLGKNSPMRKLRNEGPKRSVVIDVLNIDEALYITETSLEQEVTGWT